VVNFPDNRLGIHYTRFVKIFKERGFASEVSGQYHQKLIQHNIFCLTLKKIINNLLFLIRLF
jgi:hypothetical protein